MSKTVLAYFADKGIPASGLAPTIRIRNALTTVLEISDDPMAEVGDGFYSYDFTGFDDVIPYAIRADGGGSLKNADRYSVSTNEVSETSIASGVWDHNLPQTFPADSAGERLSTMDDRIDVTLSTRSSHSASDIDTQLSLFHGTGSWQQASGFAIAGDDMGLTAGALTDLEDQVWDATLLSHQGVGSTGEALNGANSPAIDAGDVASGVWDALRPAHVVASSFGESVRLTAAGLDTDAAQEIRDEILSDSIPFQGARIDAAITSRSSHDAADVDTQLSGTHGAGNWETGSGIKDWTDTEQEQIRFRLALDGTQTDPTTGVGTIEDILADTDSLDTTKITTARANNLDDLDTTVSSRATQAQILSDATPFQGARIDATISSRSSHSASDVDTQLSGTHGAGSWESASGIAGDWTTTEKEQMRFRLALDGVQTDPTTGVGTLEDILSDTDALDTRLPTDPADESNQIAQHVATQNLVSGLNDLSQVDVQAAMTSQGYTTGRAPNLDNLDTTVSSRSSHTAANVDSTLTSAHGAGSWQGEAAAIDEIASGVWHATLSDYTISGQAGNKLSNTAEPSDVHVYELEPEFL